MRIRTARVMLALVVVGLAVACSSDAPAPRSFEDPPAQSDPECPTNRGDERLIADLSNQEREDRGKRSFALDPQLSRVARKHTSEMIAADELVHSPPAELSRRTTNWVELNENIGKGTDARSIFASFMKSDPHRRRILKAEYNHVGVGALQDPNGTMWVTMVFESNRDPGTTLAPPVCS